MLELWEVGYHKREFFFVVSYEVFLISEILRSSLIYYTARATRVLHERHDGDPREKVKAFSHSYIYYMASERLQGEKKFHSKN